MSRFVTPNPPFFDETTYPIEPVRNGTLGFFVNETTSPKAVYLEDTELTVANDAAGLMRLDNDGRLLQPVYYSGLASVELRRQNGTLVWRFDNLQAGGGGGGGGSAAETQFIEFRYQRAAVQPGTPTGDNPTGWFVTPPADDGNPIWLTQGLKILATGALIGSWSTPVQLSGDPGASGVLEVQFSPNGIDGWDNTYDASDNWMRINQGSGFGPAIKIVGEDGSDGPYFSYIFQRAASQPATPPANDPNPAGWFDAPPTSPANLPLWASVAQLSADGTTVLIPWGVPVNIRGDDGSDGLPGISLEVQYSPNGVDSWHGPPAVATDRYIRQRLGPTAPWSTPALFVGEDGSDGPYTDFIFIRAETQPATPTGTSPSGWSDGVPSGTTPVWMSTADKAADGSLLSGWTTPRRISGDSIEVQYSANGSTGWHDPPFIDGTDNFMRQRLGDGSWSAAIRIVGENGVDGEFTDYRFRRATSRPATPTGNNPAGWFDDPGDATGTGKLWMIRGRKTAQGNLIGVWSVPVQIEGEDGQDGDAGGTGAGIVRSTDHIGTSGNSASIVYAAQGGEIVAEIRGNLFGFAGVQGPDQSTLRIWRNGTELVAEALFSLDWAQEFGFPQTTWNWFVRGGPAINLIGNDEPPAGDHTYTSEWTAGLNAPWQTELASPLLIIEEIQTPGA